MIHSNEALDVVLFMTILLPSIILHEVAHGWLAERFGDPTAREVGRITLNPIPHIDPFGSLLFPGLMALAGGPVFGWAKPVPVNPARFRVPTRTMAVVALAGPATNLLIAFAIATFGGLEVNARCGGFGFAPDGICLGGGEGILADGLGARLLIAAMVVNVALAIFNMLPIPPLDGSKLVPLVLSERARITYYRISQYGFLILFVLVFVFRGALSFIADWIGWVLRLMI